MSEATADGTPILTTDLRITIGAEGFEFGDSSEGCGGSGGAGVVTDFEREVQNLFQQSNVVYQNSQAANTSNGWTFLDSDSDGWYDHIETTNGQGIWIYCGYGEWRRL